jgi:hypothetical protein
MVRGDYSFSFVWSCAAKVWPDDFYVAYRFRIDPVPGIHKSCMGYKYIRRCLHTRNEKRAWYAAEGLGRKKRGPRHLPTDWDDFGRNLSKTWKNKKVKRQWMKNHFSG